MFGGPGEVVSPGTFVRKERTKRLVRLAEDCRGDGSHSRCILSTEHNGDPRELLESPHVLVW